MESSQFRDAQSQLEAVGVQIIGISSDPVSKQKSFAESLGLRFPLIGDERAEIIEKFDAKWPIVNKARRVTYLIDERGLIAGCFAHELAVRDHVKDVKRALGLDENAPASP